MLLSRFGKYTGNLLPVLRLLVPDDARPDEKHGLAAAQRVADVLASAERRARAHQYDAAVLRVYRALEGVAQWTLKRHHRIPDRERPARQLHRTPRARD